MTTFVSRILNMYIKFNIRIQQCLQIWSPSFIRWSPSYMRWSASYMRE